jgi:hypothetical protein
VLRAAGEITGERQFIIIGSQSLHRYGGGGGGVRKPLKALRCLKRLVF